MGENYDDKEYIFVVTYGRSGSTLLQGLLNSIEGYSIAGENHMALQHLYKFYKKMKDSIGAYKYNNMPVDKRNSWYQPLSKKELDKICRDVIFDIFSIDSSNRVVGCKEIRWRSLRDDDGTLVSFLDWLHDILDAKFIFLKRNHEEVCNSKWHKKKDTGSCKKGLQNFEKWVDTYMDCHPEQDWFWLDIGCLHPHKEVKPERFEDLFDWLNEDFNKEKINKVLEIKWGY